MPSFSERLSQALQPFATGLDVLDVLLVALVVYNLLLLIRGTRAVQILFGILALVLVYWSAGALELRALETTLQSFFLFLPVAIIVLFQQEIRRALASFGRTPLWSIGGQKDVVSTFNEIVLATTSLSERRVGALIVFERSEGLRNYIENGVEMDALVSLDLLTSIFLPMTPTHDGAVIIQGDRIAAATCFLPLTQNSELSMELGTRHRAALGISEETDAVAVVVSEETGSVSLAFDGEIVRDLEPRDLRNHLYQKLVSNPSGL